MKLFQTLLRRRHALRGAQVSALAYCLLGYAIWACADAIGKWAGASSVPKYELLVFAALGGIVSIGSITLFRGNVARLHVRRIGSLILLGVLSVCTGMGVVTGLSRLPLAQYYVIEFLCPMVIALFAAFFMREALDAGKLIAIAIGFIGVIIAINPLDVLREGSDVIGLAAAFSVVLTFSAQMLMLRVLGGKETRESIAFWPRFVTIFGALFLGCIGGFQSVPTLPYTPAH